MKNILLLILLISTSISSAKTYHLVVQVNPFIKGFAVAVWKNSVSDSSPPTTYKSSPPFDFVLPAGKYGIKLISVGAPLRVQTKATVSLNANKSIIIKPQLAQLEPMNLDAERAFDKLAIAMGSKVAYCDSTKSLKCIEASGNLSTNLVKDYVALSDLKQIDPWREIAGNQQALFMVGELTFKMTLMGGSNGYLLFWEYF